MGYLDFNWSEKNSNLLYWCFVDHFSMTGSSFKPVSSFTAYLIGSWKYSTPRHELCLDRSLLILSVPVTLPPSACFSIFPPLADRSFRSLRELIVLFWFLAFVNGLRVEEKGTRYVPSFYMHGRRGAPGTLRLDDNSRTPHRIRMPLVPTIP